MELDLGAVRTFIAVVDNGHFTDAASPDLFMFASQAQFSGRPHVVEIAVTDPTPAYPWSLLWHELNRHPSLPRLIEHVRAQYRPETSAACGCPHPTARCSAQARMTGLVSAAA